MKGTVIAVFLVPVLTLGSGACANKKAASGGAAMSRCLKDLNTIPRMRALLNSRKKNGEQVQGKPFEGVEMALTIDGMVTSQIDPEANVDDLCFRENTRENFEKILRALEANNMPPTVNFMEGRQIDRQLQTEWLRSGNLLGNMSYDGRRSKNNTAQEFVDNLARNDALLGALWNKRRPGQKYFRYPRAKGLRGVEDVEIVKAYLKESGYVAAPATIDLADGRFSQLYCAALDKGDKSCANLIKANFYSLAIDTTLKARSIAKSTAGHDVKHILIVRANQFTCDTLSETLAWYKALGARFVSLDEALNDPLYTSGEAARSLLKQTRKAQLAAADKK